MKPAVTSRMATPRMVRVEAAAARDELARHPPVLGAAALDPARSDHHVGAGPRALEHRLQVPGVVREVGVHLEDEVVAVGDGAAEAGEVGGAEPELAGPV